MQRRLLPAGITPAPGGSAAVHRFMTLYRELCPTGEDEAPIELFAQGLGWPLESVERVAEWCRDRYLIDTDAGMGDRIRMIEGRY